MQTMISFKIQNVEKSPKGPWGSQLFNVAIIAMPTGAIWQKTAVPFSSTTSSSSTQVSAIILTTYRFQSFNYISPTTILELIASYFGT